MTTRLGTRTLRLVARLSAEHADNRERSLSVLRGGLADMAGLLPLLRQLREHNQTRLSDASDSSYELPATESAEQFFRLAAEAQGQVDRTTDRCQLDAYRTIVRNMKGREGRKRATRMLRREPEADAELRLLGARFAQHCGQGCSLTGVKVAALSVRDAAAGREVPAQPLPADERDLAPGVPGAIMAGAFRVPARELHSGMQFGLTLHNVLGRTRPVVPVYIQAVAEVGFHEPWRLLPIDGGLFAYTLDVEAGTRRSLDCSANGWLDTLPCPRGLLSAVRLHVWLPTGDGRVPEPINGTGKMPFVA